MALSGLVAERSTGATWRCERDRQRPSWAKPWNGGSRATRWAVQADGIESDPDKQAAHP